MTDTAALASESAVDATTRFIVGDSLTVLRSLPDASVDLVLSSPPFLGLRSYLPAGHPDKAHEIGSEGTPGAFIDVLLDIAEECRRVLTPHGSLCFELGDTYAGSGNGPDSHQPEARGLWHERWKGERVGWPLDKSLCLIPESFRWALVYGRNPFTGRETPRWRARNVVRWCRPNPPVGSLADKVRPATSDIIIACTGRSRYFDLDGIRVPFTGHAGTGTGVRKGQNGGKPTDNRPDDLPTRMNTHDGAPPLDHWWFNEEHYSTDSGEIMDGADVLDQFRQDAWMVSTEPYHGSHYATWPRSLLVRPIVAMCPPKVCTTCGKPSKRVVDSQRVRLSDGAINPPRVPPTRDDSEGGTAAVGIRNGMGVINTTIGWTDCGHDAWRAGVVLDPFAGSGTSLAVAHGHGRSSIGIDLDERNADLARERVGMWLETEYQHDRGSNGTS